MLVRRSVLTCTKSLCRHYSIPTHMKALVLNKYAQTVDQLDTLNQFTAPQPSGLITDFFTCQEKIYRQHFILNLVVKFISTLNVETG